MAGISMVAVFGVPGPPYVFLLMVPMLCDGFLQLLTPYESGNKRRVASGTLFGIAFVFAWIYFHCTCIHVAGWILKQFWESPEKIERAMGWLL